MKTNTLILLVYLFMFQKATSQDFFGLKAGVNLAHQTYTGSATSSKTYQTKSLVGYRAGIVYKAKIVKRVWLSTAASFSSLGAKQLYLVAVNGNPSEQYIEDRLGYLEVPLLIQYDLNRFYISAGPSFSLKLYEHSSLRGTSLNYKSTDVAGILSVGYRIARKWDINLDYSHGLANIDNKASGRTRKNKYYNLSLIYTF